MHFADCIRVREVYRRIDCHNPVSGHRWTEHGPTTGYEVVGATGVLSKHRTEAAALKEAAEWQDFYTKYPGNI
jgi:hypothetical protein